jgi:hypothetical protein
MQSVLMPGQEIERCKFFVAPADGLYINGGETRYTPGSHHVLLFTTPYTSIPTKTLGGKDIDTSGVFDCASGATGDWEVTGVVGGAQTATAPPLHLPEGIALKVEPGSVLLMNTHYLNATPNPVTTEVRVNVYTIHKEALQAEAGVIFFYNPFIRVPGMSSASARMACPVLSDVTLVNGQSHMHRRGVGYVANLVDAQGNRMQELYTNDSWENVPIKQYTDTTLKTGTFVDYRCDYKNDEDRTVLQGRTTKDEMCMFVGVYYPRNVQFENCAMTADRATSDLNGRYIGSGKAACIDTLLCTAGAKSEDSYYGCVVNSCPTAATQLSDAMHCQFRVTADGGECAAVCKGGGSDCGTCVQNRCAAEISACSSAPTCG